MSVLSQFFFTSVNYRRHLFTHTQVNVTTVYQLENKFQSRQSMLDDPKRVFDFNSMPDKEQNNKKNNDEDHNLCD